MRMRLRVKMEMKKIYCFVVCLLFLVSFAFAVDESFDYEGEKDALDSGEVSDTLVENLNSGNFNNEQKVDLVGRLSQPEMRKTFFDKFEALDRKERNSFVKSLTSENQGEFITQMGGGGVPVSFSSDSKSGLLGFGGTNAPTYKTNLGDGGFVGYSNGINLKEINKINDEIVDSNEKIKSVEFKELFGGRESLVVTMGDGDSINIVSGSGKDGVGYYFDAKTKRFMRYSGEGGVSNSDDPTSGAWNGDGSAQIDASDGKLSIELDYARDDEGVAIVDDNRASIEMGNGKKFAPLDIPTVDEKGEVSSKLKKAEIVMSNEGELELLSNVNIAQEGSDDVYGNFGEDIKVLNSKEEFDALIADGHELTEEDKGTYLVIDEDGENGNRVQVHAIGEEKSTAQKLQEKLSAAKKDLEKARNSLELVKGKKDLVNDETFRDIIKAYLPLDDSNMIERFATDSLSSDSSIAMAEGALGIMAGNIDNMESLINQDMSEKTINYVSGFLDGFSKDEASGKFKSSLDFDIQSSEASFVDFGLNNEFAKNTNNVELTASNVQFSLEDNNGVSREILKKPSLNKAVYNPRLNMDDPSFDGVNMNVFYDDEYDSGRDYSEGGWLRVYSDDKSGKMQLKGYNGKSEIGFDAIKSVDIDVTAQVNVQGRVFGLISIKKSETQDVLAASLNVESGTAENAKSYLSEQRAEYRKEYELAALGSQDAVDEFNRKVGVRYTKGMSEEQRTAVYRDELAKHSGGISYNENEKLKSINNKIAHGYAAELSKGPMYVKAELGPSAKADMMKQLSGSIPDDEAGRLLTSALSSNGNVIEFESDPKNGLYMLNSYPLKEDTGAALQRVMPYAFMGVGGVDKQLVINPTAIVYGSPVTNKNFRYYFGYSLMGALRAGGEAGIKPAVEASVKKRFPQDVAKMHL